MRVAILTLPAYGHVNPTLPVARELAASGDDVVYYLPDEFAEAARSTGAECRPLSEEFDLMSRVRKIKPGQGDGRSSEERRRVLGRFMAESLDAVPDLSERVDDYDPDCLLVDPMCLWGRAVADATGVPWVAFSTSFALREESPLIDEIRMSNRDDSDDDADTEADDDDSFLGPFRERLAEHGFENFSREDFLVADADRTIVRLPPSFQPDYEAFGDDHAFVGPLIRKGDDQDRESFPFEHLDGGPGLYISLGTVFHGDEEFFASCLDAFADTEWRVVLKAKGGRDAVPGEIPENVLVRPRVPQLDVLERVDGFITHGGMNSTLEALHYGVPPVVVPQMSDQHAVAERVESLGLGVAVREGIDGETLREAVKTVAEPAYRGRVDELRTEMRESGGAERAANVLREHARANQPVQH